MTHPAEHDDSTHVRSHSSTPSHTVTESEPYESESRSDPMALLTETSPGDGGLLLVLNGDLTKWITFLDYFSSSVHSNPSLANVDKFNSLNSLSDSTATESIA